MIAADLPAAEVYSEVSKDMPTKMDDISIFYISNEMREWYGKKVDISLRTTGKVIFEYKCVDGTVYVVENRKIVKV